MRILWLCNIMLPMIAQQLHMEASNKEGWLSGLAGAVLERREKNGIELAVAFPAAGIPRDAAGVEEMIYDGCYVYKGMAKSGESGLLWYAFAEDTANPHLYDEKLELQMHAITRDFQPDVVHCFGTEYPHTLAMCRSFPQRERILIGIQGLCKVYADAYFASLPRRVINTVTLRDFLKRDSLRQQQRKFVLRGEMEYEAVRLAGNVTGRTAWDRHYTAEWNQNARYFKMNETLRPNFYTGQWNPEECEPHTIFLSQGDYPIKGLHYMLLALPAIRKVFPDVKVYVAGNSIIGEDSLAKRLKISAYGSYLRRLIRRYKLQEQLCFLGRLDAEQMKERYLKSNLFVCCSTIENSPNSLGEAMILGVPCVSADVGGISSIFTHGKDGILYEGFKGSDNSINNIRNKTEGENQSGENEQERIAANLADAVIRILSNAGEMGDYSTSARNHAKITHEKEANYIRMTEIYSEIMNQMEESEKFQK
ncbi:MAG: glycosyltransferase family 4 protein, partial [Acetatifactor sp.]|nr:glycosyltransferase family 4 protein [Acetatifactor sp.]